MWSLLYQTIVASNRSVLLILHPQQSTWDWEKSLQLPLLRIALPEISGMVGSLKLWDTPNPAPYNPKSLPGSILGLPLAENNQRHSFRRRAPCQGRDKERRQLCPDQSSPSARAARRWDGRVSYVYIQIYTALKAWHVGGSNPKSPGS